MQTKSLALKEAHGVTVPLHDERIGEDHASVGEMALDRATKAAGNASLAGLRSSEVLELIPDASDAPAHDALSDGASGRADDLISLIGVEHLG